MTTIFDACKSGNLGVVKQLVEQGADVNDRDKDNMTPLLCACEAGHLPVAKYLIEEMDCSIEDKGKFDFDCLTFAFWKGHVPLAKYLNEERKASEQQIMHLHAACAGGSLEAVRYFIEEKQYNVTYKDSLGRNGLMYACGKGHLPIVQYLIERHRVNIKEKDASGNTCLTLACKYDRHSVVKYLIIDCWMDPPPPSKSYSNEMNAFLQKCTTEYLNEQRRCRFIEIKDFMHECRLKQVWDDRQSEAFFQQVPPRVSHTYQLVLSDPDRFSDLKICFKASVEWNGEHEGSNLVTIYAQKKRLSESCTFMRKLLSDEFNDVQVGSEEGDMQTIQLSQELLQGCSNDWLKQLLIFLAWSQEGDELHHHANAWHDGKVSLQVIVEIARYCRSCNALGLDVDVSAWIQLIEKYLEKFNQEWIESTLKSGQVGEKEDRCIRGICPLDQEMFDLFTQVMEENDVLYFFLMVNSARATLESPETAATKCREWLLSPKASGKYADTLKNAQVVGSLHFRTGIHFTSGIVFVPFDEEFVKRQKRRQSVE